jgi:hypothetical protein
MYFILHKFQGIDKIATNKKPPATSKSIDAAGGLFYA